MNYLTQPMDRRIYTAFIFAFEVYTTLTRMLKIVTEKRMNRNISCRLLFKLHKLIIKSSLSIFERLKTIIGISIYKSQPNSHYIVLLV
jgi:hypothetical protein